MGEQVKPERGSNGRFTPREAVEQVTEHAREIQAEAILRKTQGEARLDDALAMVKAFVACGEAEAVAMTLYAAATWAADTFAAFGRMLYVADGPESGKTVAMLTTAYLSANPENANGTRYALSALFADYENDGNKGRPCLYKDEIQELFGRSGLNGASSPLANVLREGYKRTATQMWSVQRSVDRFSIYGPFLMAGLGTAVPQDVRSRSIVIKCVKGRPALNLDSVGMEDDLRMTAEALGKEVKRAIPLMRGFDCEGARPGMDARKAQVWIPLIAVATHVGSKRWEEMAYRAFEELYGTENAKPTLSASQQTLKDCADTVRALGIAPGDFVGGMMLAGELRELPRFAERTLLSVARTIAAAMPIEPHQKHTPREKDAPPANPVRGYFARDILAAWDLVKPAGMHEFELAEQISPF
jgi:hypothetical protein